MLYPKEIAAMPTLTESWGNLLGIDLALRVPVKYAEIYMPVSLAAEVLGRSPDVATSRVLSWGGLDRQAIKELIELTCDPSAPEEAIEEMNSLFDGAGTAELQWCLHFSNPQEEPNGK